MLKKFNEMASPKSKVDSLKDEKKELMERHPINSKKISDFLKKLEFNELENTLVGKPALYTGRINEDVKFFMDMDYLVCSQNDNIIFRISVYNGKAPTREISIGTLLVLLQEYGIIHERFIYESVDHIYEEFQNQYED